MKPNTSSSSVFPTIEH